MDDPRTAEADSRTVIIRWLVSLDESLIPGRRRRRIEADFAGVLVAEPVLTDIWVSGMLRAILESLPAEDPWRNLAARIAGPGDRIDTWGTPPADGTPADSDASDLDAGLTGMWSDRGPFGSWLDHTDLAFPDGSDPDSDPTLAGGHRDLPELSGVLLAGAGHGAAEGWRAIRRIRTIAEDQHGSVDTHIAHGDVPSAADLFGTAEGCIPESDRPVAATLFWLYDEAIRSVIFRRRAYNGLLHDAALGDMGDTGIELATEAAVMVGAMPRSEQDVVLSGLWSDVPVWSFDDEERVADGSYEQYRTDNRPPMAGHLRSL